MRNCCLGSELSRPVSLLLVLAASCRLFTYSSSTELTVVPELRGVLQLPELHARYATGASLSGQI